jgi:hypothetical protein
MVETLPWDYLRIARDASAVARQIEKDKER